MPYTATFDDWLTLLGIRAEFMAAYEGRRAIGATVADLHAARDRWPGVDQDYVDVLNQATEAVLTLREIIAEQAAWLARLHENVHQINALQEYVPVPTPPGAPDDRLLDKDELDAIRLVHEAIDEAVGAIEHAPPHDDDIVDDDWRRLS